MKNPIIVFVCEHGAAKSIIAAAYFNKLAEEANSEIRAMARGTTPDQELSPKTVSGLKADGLIPTGMIPQKLSIEDVEGAQKIVTFCELPVEYQSHVPIETWDGIPPVSENYELARDEIVKRVKQLFEQ